MSQPGDVQVGWAAHQRCRTSGLVQASNTSSGAAGNVRSRWSAPASSAAIGPLLLLGEILVEDVELALPQLALAVQPRARRAQRVVGQPQAVQAPVHDAHD